MFFFERKEAAYRQVPTADHGNVIISQVNTGLEGDETAIQVESFDSEETENTLMIAKDEGTLEDFKVGGAPSLSQPQPPTPVHARKRRQGLCCHLVVLVAVALAGMIIFNSLFGRQRHRHAHYRQGGVKGGYYGFDGSKFRTEKDMMELASHLGFGDDNVVPADNDGLQCPTGMALESDSIPELVLDSYSLETLHIKIKDSNLRGHLTVMTSDKVQFPTLKLVNIHATEGIKVQDIRVKVNNKGKHHHLGNMVRVDIGLSNQGRLHKCQGKKSKLQKHHRKLDKPADEGEQAVGQCAFLDMILALPNRETISGDLQNLIVCGPVLAVDVKDLEGLEIRKVMVNNQYGNVRVNPVSVQKLEIKTILSNVELVQVNSPMQWSGMGSGAGEKAKVQVFQISATSRRGDVEINVGSLPPSSVGLNLEAFSELGSVVAAVPNGFEGKVKLVAQHASVQIIEKDGSTSTTAFRREIKYRVCPLSMAEEREERDSMASEQPQQQAWVQPKLKNSVHGNKCSKIRLTSNSPEAELAVQLKFV